MTSKSNHPAYRKLFETLKGQSTGYTLANDGGHLFIAAVSVYGSEHSLPKRTRTLLDDWVRGDPARIAARNEWRRILNSFGFDTVGGSGIDEARRLATITPRAVDMSRRGTGHAAYSRNPRPAVKSGVTKTSRTPDVAKKRKAKLAVAVKRSMEVKAGTDDEPDSVDDTEESWDGCDSDDEGKPVW